MDQAIKNALDLFVRITDNSKSKNINLNMPEKDLSILIPARNEMFLSRTVEDIIKNSEANTEVIVVLDGAWADPVIPQHKQVNVVYVPNSIGQRAATNLAAKLSRSKYVMKCDAHCSFDKGFDRKMLEMFKVAGDNVTMVPIMRNLWAFDWKCYHCGWKKYQGPTPEKCEQCSKADKIRRKMIWVGKKNPQSTSYCFDSTPHFQYFEDWKHRPQYEKDMAEKGLTETMSLQGSCWMLKREKYWDLNVCDENFGGWGSQGIEVAVKTWLSGGQVLVNHKTWYAHMFRTQGGDFGFPYPISSSDQAKAQQYAKNLFFNGKWDKQIRPLSWLVEKFWPVRGWTEEDLENLKKNKFEFKNKIAGINTSEIEPTEKPLSQSKINHKALEPITTVESIGNVLTSRRGRPKKQYKELTIINETWLSNFILETFPDAYIYDPPRRGGKQRANQGEIAFVCTVPKLNSDGTLNFEQIENEIEWCECSIIVIRSVLPVGMADNLSQKYRKNIVLMPPFYGEYNLKGIKQSPPHHLIIGGEPHKRKIITELVLYASNNLINIRQLSRLEAEVVKLTEYRAIYLRLQEFQELLDACDITGIDYHTIASSVYDDPRFSLWGAFINQPEQLFDGLSSKIIDQWTTWLRSFGINSKLSSNIKE